MKKNIIRSFFALLAYAAGVFFGVYAGVVWDVNVSLIKMESTPPVNWPNMDPRVRFLLVPVLFLFFFLIGAFVGLILDFLGWRMRYWWGWFFAGFAYSVPVVFYALAVFPGIYVYLVLCVFLMVVLIILTYKYLGKIPRYGRSS